VVLKTGKEASEVALNTIFKLPGTEPRVILMRNTLTVRYLLVSKVIYDEEKKRGGRFHCQGIWEKPVSKSDDNLSIKI
jgi:hypothetical protein